MNKNKFEFLAEESLNLFGDELVSVVVFGSYGRKNYDKNSDLDLMIIKEKESEIDISKMRKKFLIGFEKKLDPHVFTKEDVIRNFEDYSPLFTTLLLGKIILFDKDMFFKKEFDKFVKRIIYKKILYCEKNKIWEMKKVAENLGNLH